MTVRRSPTGARGLGVGMERLGKWWVGDQQTNRIIGGVPATGNGTRVATLGRTSFFLGDVGWENGLIADETCVASGSFTVGVTRAQAMSTNSTVGYAFAHETDYFSGTQRRAGIILFDTNWKCLWNRESAYDQLRVSAYDPAGVHIVSDGILHWSDRTNTLSKLSLATGAVLWSVANVQAMFIRTDSSGNIYIGGDDTTIRKFDSSGSHQWTRTVTSTVRQIAVNSSGDVAYAYGSAGNIYTGLMNTSGTQQWVRSLAVAGAAAGGVAFDSAGNVYTLGYVNTGAGVGTYIAKYDSSGTLSFHRRINTGGTSTSRLTMDSKDRLVFIGGPCFRLPSTVPTGTYSLMSGSTVTIAAGSLTASTPAHTLTTGSFTGTTTYPPDQAGPINEYLPGSSWISRSYLGVNT